MRRFASVLALTAALCAQDRASPYRFVPKDALAVVRCSGPAAWREQFAKTQLQKLLLGEAAAPLRKAVADGFAQALDEIRSEGRVDADALEKTLLGYGGEFVVAIGLDLDDLPAALADDRPPKFMFALTLTPDGHTDFAPLLEQLSKAAEAEGTERGLRDLVVGDHRLRVGGDDEASFTLPFLVDGNVVLIGGTDIEKTAQSLLAGDSGGFTPPEAQGGSALCVHVELERVLGAILAFAGKEEVAQQIPFDAVKLLTDLGAASLKRLDLAAGADGEHVALEFAAEFNEQERGLFAVAMPDAKGRPRLLEVLPAGAEYFSVSPFDLRALWNTVEKIWTGLGPLVPLSVEDAMTAFTEACKVRLEEDLLAHLGTELLMVQDVHEQIAAAAAGDQEDEVTGLAAAFSGNCLALGLADGRAFGDNLEKLLRARGLHASRKTEEYAGAKVHRLRLLGAFEVEYAVLPDMLLVAPGRAGSGGQQLRAILDEQAARAAGKPAPELSANVRERLDRMPGGWNGIGTTPIAAMIDAFMAGLTQAKASGAEIDDEVMEFLGVLGKLRGELRQLGLDFLVSTQYVERRKMRAVARW